MNIVLTALALGAEPAIVENKAPTLEIRAEVQEKNQVGQNAIQKIRADYLVGNYKETLKELDDSFSEVSEEGGLENLAEMRIGPGLDQKAWQEIMKKTLADRNQELNKAIQGEDGDLSEKVRSATQSLEPNVEESLLRLNQLHMLAPGQGASADENAIIDIDFEYEYKAIHLDMPVFMGQKGEDLRSKQIAVTMEKLDRMLELSQNFQDKDLKSAVETIHANLDSLLAQNWDLSDLHALTRSASTQSEEKVAQILNDYRDKFSQMSKEFLEKQTVMNNAETQ